MKTKLYLVITVLLLVITPLVAEEITIDKALEIAKSNNLSIVNADIDIVNAIYKDKHDYHSLLPSVSVSGTLNRPNTGYLNSDPTTQLILGINLSYNFNPAMITSLKVAPINVTLSELEKQKLVAETETNVKKLFYAIIFQQQALEIQKESLVVFEQRYEEALTKYQEGYAMELDVLQAEVSLENKRNEILKAEREIEKQLLSFKYLLALPLDEEITLVGNLDYILPEKETLKVGISTDELILEENINLLNVQKSILKQQVYIPSIAVSMSYQPVLRDITGSWASENFNDSGSMSVSVAFNLTNMLPSSSPKLSLKELEYTNQKLVNSQKMLSDSNNLMLKQSLESMQSIQDAIASAERTIEMAEKSVEMTRELYMNGYTDLVTLKEAESQLEMAKLSRLSEEFNYINALIDLETITGQDLI